MQKALGEKANQASDIAKLGSILSVWAHPDDETFCCGGLLSWAAHNGQRVACVTATRGEDGSQDSVKWPPAKLAGVRTEEMAAALAVLGITEHRWLDYADGCCAQADDDEAVERIAGLIESFRPDTLLTFGREGMTGHPDHMAVCRWSHAALKRAGSEAAVYHPVIDRKHYQSHLKLADEKLDIFFAIDEPPLKSEAECAICLKLPPVPLERKLQAIAAMPSQTAVMLEVFDQAFLNEAWSVESFVRCNAEAVDPSRA